MNEFELIFCVLVALVIGVTILALAINFIAPTKKPEPPLPELPDGWHYVRGGACPVPPGITVEVAMARIKQTLIGKAGNLNWDWENYNDDIVAYRVVNPIELEIALLVEERNRAHLQGGFMWCESPYAQSLTKRINELEGMLK